MKEQDMKSILFNLWQTSSRRLLLCTLSLAALAMPAMAQNEDDDEEEDEMEAMIKQPVRRATASKYPTVSLQGVVVDQATGKPLSGIQLQAMGHVR